MILLLLLLFLFLFLLFPFFRLLVEESELLEDVLVLDSLLFHAGVLLGDEVVLRLVVLEKFLVAAGDFLKFLQFQLLLLHELLQLGHLLIFVLELLVSVLLGRVVLFLDLFEVLA